MSNCGTIRKRETDLKPVIFNYSNTCKFLDYPAK